MNIKAGDKLANGATVLAFKTMNIPSLYGGPRSVVLAFTDENAATPYVTWRMNDDGSTYWGHYHKTDREAFDEFNSRW